jgi:PIN domain nuclease of toxin-antitoxin system
VNLLLDTHALLWWWAADPMEAKAHAAITNPANLVAVSAATVWEITVKRAQGKLRLNGPIVDLVAESAFEPLPIAMAHAERAADLPPHHRDPFDRLLIAQAQAERLRLVTRDPAFDAYEVDVLHC